jgi:hypothetical protein
MSLLRHLLPALSCLFPVLVNAQAEFEWRRQDTLAPSLRHAGLALYADSGRLGLATTGGQRLTPPAYDRIFGLEGLVARTTRDGRFGWIDRAGHERAAPTYFELRSFADGFAAYRDSSTGLWGIVGADGRILHRPRFDEVSAFHEGRAIMRSGIHYGIIDTAGAVRTVFDTAALRGIPNEYFAQDFFDLRRLALNPARSLLLYREGRALYRAAVAGRFRFGYLGAGGQKVIAPQFDDASNFKEGLAAVKRGGLWSLIDSNGAALLPFRYAGATVAPAGLLILSTKAGTGVADRKGSWRIPPRYQNIVAGPDSFFYVFNGSGWGLLHASGRTILQPVYTGIRPLGPGRFLATELASTYSLNTGVPRFSFTGRIYLADDRGHIDSSGFSYTETRMGGDFFHPSMLRSSPFVFTVGGNFEDGWLLIGLSRGSGFPWDKHIPAFPAFMDAKGRLMPTGRAYPVMPFIDGLAVLRLETDSVGSGSRRPLYGLIDKTGRTLLPNSYTELRPLAWPWASQLVLVALDGKWGVVDTANSVVLPLQWESLLPTTAGAIVGMGETGSGTRKMRYGFIDLSGKLLVPIVYDRLVESDRGLLHGWKEGKHQALDKSGAVLPLDPDSLH